MHRQRSDAQLYLWCATRSCTQHQQGAVCSVVGPRLPTMRAAPRAAWSQRRSCAEKWYERVHRVCASSPVFEISSTDEAEFVLGCRTQAKQRWRTHPVWTTLIWTIYSVVTICSVV